MPTLERISVTPLKGTSLHHPAEIEVTPAGITGDRRFYLVEESGRMLSGATFGPLVTIVADHDPETDDLTLRFPDGTVVTGRADRLAGAEVTDFFGRAVASHEVEGPWAEAVSGFVGQRVRLMRSDREGEAVDVFPITVISTASIRDLAERGGHDGPLDGRRFRINLELGDCEPYDEDSWDGRTISIGDVRMGITGAIPRCLVTTQGPETGVKDWNTLTQIARYRPRIPGDGGLPFGMYATVVRPGVARLGDTVQVHSRGTTPS